MKNKKKLIVIKGCDELEKSSAAIGLSAQEIKKISKEFKIPEKNILDFLTDEEKLLRISVLKQSFLEQVDINTKIAVLKKWQNECKNFSDFEEIYVMVDSNLIKENFYFNWLDSTKNYIEKREIYACVIKEYGLIVAEKFVEAWMDKASDLEDIREAMARTSCESEAYKIGLKKIIKIYKN